MSTGGHVLLPARRAQSFDPPREVVEAWESGPVIKVDLYGERWAWLVTRYEDVRAVLCDNRRFSSLPAHQNYPSISRSGLVRDRLERSLVKLDDPQHARIRRLVGSYFTPSAVAAYSKLIDGVVRELLDAIASQSPPVDLVAEFALPVPSKVICGLLGVSYERFDEYQRQTAARLVPSGDAERAVAATASMLSYVDGIVAEKERNVGGDLISRLIVGPCRAGELTRDELVSLVRLLLSAGHGTTANTISLGALLLLTHPAALADLRAQPSLIDSAVDEILRYTTVAQYHCSRVAVVDVEIGGVHIRAGDGVIAMLTAANRDPEVFAQPDVFDIRRPASKHLTFGTGAHFCTGASLARTELVSALGTLMTRFDGLELVGSLADVRFEDGSLWGLKELLVNY